MKKWAALAFGLVMAFASAASAAEDSRGTLGEIVKAKKIVIMNDLSAAPWQFRDANGNAAGFSVDLNRLIAAKLDVDLEMRNVEWAGLIPGLLARKSDILATSMSTTFKRAQQILFTQGSWYSTGVVAIVKPENKDKSWEELNQEGKRIAVKAGTNAVDAAKQFFPKAELQTYPNDVDTYQALKTDRVDATLNDLAVLGVGFGKQRDDLFRGFFRRFGCSRRRATWRFGTTALARSRKRKARLERAVSDVHLDDCFRPEDQQQRGKNRTGDLGELEFVNSHFKAPGFGQMVLRKYRCEKKVLYNWYESTGRGI